MGSEANNFRPGRGGKIDSHAIPDCLLKCVQCLLYPFLAVEVFYFLKKARFLPPFLPGVLAALRCNYRYSLINGFFLAADTQHSEDRRR